MDLQLVLVLIVDLLIVVANELPTATQHAVITPARIWDVIVKTCDVAGAGTDAAAYLKVYYSSVSDGETFPLDNPEKNDFERGSRDHFKLRFRQRDVVNIGLFWWPGFSLSQQWCVDWVLLLNSDTETCYEAQFNKWIHHYRDPPTYATSFSKLAFNQCVGPAPPNATRVQYTGYDEPGRLRSS